MDLNTAIDEWSTYRRGSGFAENTVRSGTEGLKAFMAVTGNIQVRSLDTRHGEMFLSTMLSKGYKPATVNLRLSMVKSFVKWARHRRIMQQNQDPLATVRYQKVETAPRRRVPVHDFARLLDAADRPQTRMLVALGLYLFLRQSEATLLKVGDVDLDAGEVRVYQEKTSRWDVMPICAELDAELRRWLTWYAEDQASVGPLETGWFLVPARRPMRPDLDIPPPVMNPKRRMTRTSDRVHQALRGIGWEVASGDMEGCHTLRRSGARALFDELETRSRDGALRYVASMLHHKSVTQTEHYLGLDVDREKRDDLLRGVRMFSAPDRDNVVEFPTTEMGMA